MRENKPAEKCKYGDEEVIKLLNEYKKGVWGDIETGFYIKEDFYKFVRKDIVEDELSVYIPIRFRELKKKETPDWIFTEKFDMLFINSKGDIQLTFKLTEAEVNEEKLECDMEYIEKCVKKINNSVCIFDRGDISVNEENKIRWFDYKVMFDVMTVYILYFTVQVSGKMLYGKFSCEYRKSIYWKPIFLEMLNTIEVY